MKRAVRRTLLSVGLASVVTAVTVAATVAPSWATPPKGLENIALARGTNTSHGTIPLQFGTDVAMAQITVQPGGSAGWHSHPGGAIVVVKQGSLTVYSPVGHQCRTTTYSAGQAFIERPGEVDNVLNTGTIPSKALREAAMHLTGRGKRGLFGESYRVKRDITVSDLISVSRQVIHNELDVVRDAFDRNGPVRPTTSR